MKIEQFSEEKYRTEGYAMIRSAISEQRVKILQDCSTKCLSDTSDPGRVTERDGETVRGLHGTHLHNETIADLCSTSKILDAAKNLIGDPVYVHQFKLNQKAAFVGDVWEWHQDMTFYHHEDGIPEPKFLTAAVFLDDVNEFNGPLLLIPRSHRNGLQNTTTTGGKTDPVDRPWLSNTTAKLKYTPDKEIVKKLIEKNGIFAAKGKAGDCVLFHANLFHASGANLSPHDRRIAFISYNSTSNTPIAIPSPRPDFLASRNYQPLVSSEIRA
jgi:ectoine hydroxylase